MLPGRVISPALILTMVRRRVWLIAIPPAVTLFAALVYSSSIVDLYQSEMLIAVDPQRVPDSFVRSTVTLGTDRRIEALKVKVLSKAALQELIERHNLYPEERKTWHPDDVTEKMRAAIGLVMQIPRPRWGEEPQPTAFRVQFTYADPDIATSVTDELGHLFVDKNVQDRGALAGATNKFLESQLAESRAKLEEQERKLEQFRQQHGQELPTQMNSNMQALSAAQIQVQSLVESMARDRDRKLMLERLYREAVNEARTTVPAAPARNADSGAPVSGSVRQQLAAAKASLAALELKYTSDHPDVARARRQVEDLEPRAAAEIAAIAAQQAASNDDTPPQDSADQGRRESLRQMRAEVESLERQMQFKEGDEQRIRSEIAEYHRRVEAVPGLESEWASLSRDYDTQQAAYRELLSKSSAAQLAANLEEQNIGERFRIVDPAANPIRPLPSSRIRYNAIGLALGLAVGFGIALLLELRDKSFRTDTDVLEVLMLPVLATVPRVETTVEKARNQRRRMAVSLAGAACMCIAGYVTWSLKLWNSVW